VVASHNATTIARKRPEERQGGEPNKGKRAKVHQGEGTSTNRPKVDSLADWSCIPSKESFWVRGLLDGGSTCTLSVLPCMRDELLMPRVVFESINSNRGRIVFYANVEHALLCPRSVAFFLWFSTFFKVYALPGTWCWGARFIIIGAMIRSWPYASWTVFKYTSRERPLRPCACLCAAFRPSASSTIRSSRKSVFDGLSFRRRITHASKNSASSSSSSSAAVAAKVMASLYTRP